MNHFVQSFILQNTFAEKILNTELIQNLWSNYGQIFKVGLIGGNVSSVVVKHIQLSKAGEREGRQSLSHTRKVKSYQIEANWYKNFSQFCGNKCRVPKMLGFTLHKGDLIIVLEDLNKAGFSKRKIQITWKEIETALCWLADFHATFLGEIPDGLWETGTYWHLATRPDELQCLTDPDLKNAASAIDHKLRSAKFQTFVHGDAKLANLCYSENGEKVAAVDFQYVGAGVGLKDVAYFISSCLDEAITDELETQILDCYFSQLKKSVVEKRKSVDLNLLESEWRALYYFAWTDFYRFWKGWAGGNWSKDSYSERVKRKVLAELT